MKKSSRVLYIIAALLVAAQAVVSVLLVVSVFRMNVLPVWANIAFTVVMAISFIICALPLIFTKKRWLVFRVICIILSVLCVGGGVFALRYTDSINAFLDKISLTSDQGTNVAYSELDITKDPYILYISGSDSRTSVDDPGARSDVNILAVINPIKRKILLVSIPRDTYVQLHGTTGLKDKLTHAGLNNNTELSKATLEDFLGIKISHVLKVSFETVVNVVDQLDGIEIYSDTAMHLGAESKKHPGKYCNFIEGTQEVDGDCALRFARERKTYLRGDRHRGENQQEVLTGIINKAFSSNNYLMRLPEILDIVGNSFTTSFTRDEITGFMRAELNAGKKWQIESIGLDGTGDMLPTYTYGEKMPLWVMIPDEMSLEQVISKISENLSK